MNEDHRKLIDSNKSRLIADIHPTTTFMDIFITDGVIAHCDKEMIETLLGNTTKVSKLLDLLKSRSTGFAVLIKALKETKQDGPLILLGQNIDSKNKVLNHASNSSGIIAGHPTKQPAQQISGDLVVGSKGCSIPRIVTIIEDSPVGHTFLGRWNDFARRLEIPAERREVFRKSIQDDKRSISDVFELILENWKLQEAEEATLKILLKTIDEFGSTEIATKIGDKFGLKDWKDAN